MLTTNMLTTNMVTTTPTTTPAMMSGALAAVTTVTLAALLFFSTTGASDATQPIAAAFPAWLAAPPQPPASPQAPVAAGNPYIYSDVAERAVKSVVSITTSKLIKRSSHQHRGYSPFFGRPGSGQRGFGLPPGTRTPHGSRGQGRLRQGAGSGVIVRKDGLILTNNHVIAGADKIRVQLADRRAFDATVVGSDPKTDLAVLKLTGKVGKLEVLQLANSERVRLGEVVLAIGNSFGKLHHTVTMGIVSAKGRGNVGIVDYEDFIQTDAAINPGNSGGALVNMRGELIGINTAIASRSGGSQGVGFAIPANMARTVMTSIIDHGRVNRGWLGVVIQEMDDEMMKAFGTRTRGVLLGDVAHGSPAAKAGLRRGDVVLSVSGRTVETTARLRNMIALAGEGNSIKLNVLRRSGKVDISVKLGKAPGQGAAAPTAVTKADERIGMILEPLDPQTRRQHRIGRDLKHGVVIVRVQLGSIAANAGLRAGDVLVEVGRAPFRDIKDAVKRIEEAKNSLLLTVRRGKHNMYVMLRLN